MEAGTRVRRREGVVTRLEEDEAFLFHPASGSIKLLNPSATELWQLLIGEVDAAFLAEGLSARYPDVDPVAVAGDVGSFLDDLLAAGMIEEVASSAQAHEIVEGDVRG